MAYFPDHPLIVQNDHTILLEVAHPAFDEVRQELSVFAELVKSPEYIHTYRVTPLSIWNAAAADLSADHIVSVLEKWSKFDVPPSLTKEIRTQMSRYGLIRLEDHDGIYVLTCSDSKVWETVRSDSTLQRWIIKSISTHEVAIDPDARGLVKQHLLKRGYPVADRAGYVGGEALSVALKENTVSGSSFALRAYQQETIEAFYQGGSVLGGSGVLVLPCGAGKTVIGLGVMARVRSATLILAPNATSVRQWIREIVDKTTIPRDWIGEYTGHRKEVKPITVATYQILTHRVTHEGKHDFPHLQLFRQRDWGLIIYDEVHLLPAPMFRATADIQAKRRLGLTATLVREDGREEDVFSLVGPKKADVPWKSLEQDGWIANAACWEIRTPLPYERQRQYAAAPSRQQYRVACENPRKIGVLKRILQRHRKDRVLVIGQYLDHLREISAELGAPLITGKVPQDKRDHLYHRFQCGQLPVLVVSKVANFAIDLPDAAVAVQISGTFGSRQEEAQRLGRILRPKAGNNQAYFYTIVSRDTKDQVYAMKRQRFLVEQGYQYTVMDAEEMEEAWMVSS